MASEAGQAAREHIGLTSLAPAPAPLVARARRDPNTGKVNAVLRHGPSDPRDYQPRPIPAALAPAWAELMAA